MKLYWSDLHLDHLGAIGSFQRTFASVDEMNAQLLSAWANADPDAHVYNLGDVAFNLRPFAERNPDLFAPLLAARERQTLIAGNNDGVLTASRRTFGALFGTIVGDETRWKENTLIVDDEVRGRAVRVLLSHRPQQDLQQCDYNLFGHIHTGYLRDRSWVYAPEMEWFSRCEPHASPYINVCVELIGYRPRSLGELLGMRKIGLHLW